ncbi:MAG: hypothetical protein ACPLPT_08925 [Moorellales bacterium]
MGGEAAVEVARFCAQRDHYWANALDCAARKELRKASELAWGAAAQALKALAASAAAPRNPPAVGRLCPGS